MKYILVFTALIALFFAGCVPPGEYPPSQETYDSLAVHRAEIEALWEAIEFYHGEDSVPPVDPPDPDPDYEIVTYFYQDFEDNTLGTYLRDEWHDDFRILEANGYNWRDSQEGTRADSSLTVRVVEIDGNKHLSVDYLEGNFGTYPKTGSDCGVPGTAVSVRGSGELFKFSFEDLVPEGYGTEVIWTRDSIYIAPGFHPAKGGKFGYTMRMGYDHGQGSCAPNSYEGFSGIQMFWGDGTMDTPLIVDYVYHQIYPFDGCDNGQQWAQTYYWDLQGPRAELPVGRWFVLTKRYKPNTFTNGTANYDGVIEGWIDNEMLFRKTGLMFIHGNREGWPWVDSEFATFFGGSCESHRSKRDEKFIYGTHWIGRIEGEGFTDVDTVSRDQELPHMFNQK